MSTPKTTPEVQNEILPRPTLAAIVSHRDTAIAKMKEAVDLLESGFAAAEDALKHAEGAYGGAVFEASDYSRLESYRALFQRFEGESSLDAFRKQVDARTWVNLISLTGMRNLMDRTAVDALYQDLSGEVPEISEEVILNTFQSLMQDSELIFQRGLARCFGDLDRRFKSHEPLGSFKLGSRIILTYVFDSWGSLSYTSRVNHTLADVERVFAVLDGKAHHDNDTLVHAIRKSREGGGLNPRQSVTETPYFRVRGFKNGNAHLWFKRDDLVQKANKVLRSYFGSILQDGVPMEVSDEQVRTSTALSKDLAFYPTSTEIVHHVLRNEYIEGRKVLEPSAGEGAFVRELLSRGAARVDAIEVHPDRARAIEAIADSRLTVYPTNFLRMEPRPVYDLVVMNPPFHGTHWMDHVVHAYNFLAPGGRLLAILPITADLGMSSKHEKFRKWAKERSSGWGSMFEDLPAESFSHAGTMVNTVVLSLGKNR